MTVPAEPLFLSREDVEEIHAYQTRVFGGSPGLRDSGLLESAVATPQSSFGGKFLYADVFEMAAAYMVSIIGNHPFLDGNKRTGAMSAAVFLEVNGYDFRADASEFTAVAFKAAQGKISGRELADFFRRAAKPRGNEESTEAE